MSGTQFDACYNGLSDQLKVRSLSSSLSSHDVDAVTLSWHVAGGR